MSERETTTRDSGAVRDGGAAADDHTLIPLGFGGWLNFGYRAYAAMLQRRFAPHRINVLQWAHLRALWGEDGLTQVELCRRIRIKKASSTAVVDGLERRRLVRRTRNNADRRKFNIHLTQTGRELRKPLTACVDAAHAQAGRGMSAEERRTLFALLARVIDNCSGGLDRVQR